MFSHCSKKISAFALSLVGLSGCSHSSTAVSLPSYDGRKISAAALEQLDANHDGALDSSELEKAPGLRAARKNVHEGKDSSITSEDIENRIAQYESSHVGLRNETFTFMLDGSPLEDALVVMTPEPFFANSIKAGQGQTGRGGTTSVKIEGVKLRGLACGMYQVAVSKKDGAGKELIPAKYNTQTTLGFELPPKESSQSARMFKLSSK